MRGRSWLSIVSGDGAIRICFSKIISCCYLFKRMMLYCPGPDLWFHRSTEKTQINFQSLEIKISNIVSQALKLLGYN